MSRLVAISIADFTETSCSSEQPPNKIAIVSLSMRPVPFEVQTSRERLFDGVVQVPHGVVGGVGCDDRVGKLLQPHQKWMVDRSRCAIGVEDPFLAFETGQG